MANRFWVGGTGTWNTSSTTNWSATSGGSGGASVPTAADSVFFDQLATYTVTMTGALLCLDFNASSTSTSATLIFTGTGTLAISGSMLVTNNTVPIWSATGLITFNGAGINTVTSGGISFACPITFSNSAGSWTLGSSLTTISATALTFGAGSFNTSNIGNYAVTAVTITLSATGLAYLALNASTVTITGVSASFNNPANFDPGTSQINCTTLLGFTLNTNGPRTFYNMAFTGASSATAQLISISAPTTFNNLYIRGPNNTGYRQLNISGTLTFGGGITVNGILTTDSAKEAYRVLINSATETIIYDLTVNGTTSLTDTDFRDIRVLGTASPISGTRIGNLRGCGGITFSTPKTVYWNRPAGGDIFDNNPWALSSGGATNSANLPLAQDTAIIEDAGLNTSATVTWSTFLPYAGAFDMSNRTTAMTFATGTTAARLHGDLKLSASVTMSGTGILTFSGRNTQRITSAGRSFTQPIAVDSIGGAVELADAFIQPGIITVTNGTFTTNGFAVTANALSFNNTNVRTLNLGNSSILLNGGIPISCTVNTNLTFNPGTSTITFGSSSATPTSPGLTLNNLVVGSGGTYTFNGTYTFANLTHVAPNSVGTGLLIFGADQIITGTLTCTGSNPTRRIYVRSTVIGTPRILTIGTLSADDCDFRDIAIAGTAINTSPARAGDCGGNSGIIFPASKNVYWNLTGAQLWTANGWASSSAGIPAVTNFPLAQDIAIFDDAGAATTVTVNISWNIGSINMSGRTIAMTLATGTTAPTIYGNWQFGSGITTSGTGALTFSGRTTQTITSVGKTFTQPITIDSGTFGTGSVQLADALSLASASTLTLTTGTFDAVTYNVNVGLFVSSSSTVIRTLKMGSGIWTLSGTGTVFNVGSDATAAPMTYYAGAATIVLSDTTNAARTFAGGNLYYNKLTIGGATGSSTLSFTGTNVTIGELASTKTVAHTIAFGSVSPVIGKWSVTGTAGNLVTISGTAGVVLSGDRVSGVNYLALGSTAITSTNPVEFYAGVNSTGTGINTIAPVAVTRYWVGGTGQWFPGLTTNWSAASGGSGGASDPTSADTVIFDSASATAGAAYTVTLNAGVTTQVRCASLSISGTTGGVTFAGTSPLSITQSCAIASTGVTHSYTGTITLSGTGTGKTIGLGGLVLSTVVVDGIGSEWALASGGTSTNLTLTNGSFNTAGYSLTFGIITVDRGNKVTLSLGSSTITSTAGGRINFTQLSTTWIPANLTFNAETSTISMTGTNISLFHGGKSFYNVLITDQTSGSGIPLNGSSLTPTFENLTIWNPSAIGIKGWSVNSNIIVNGTLTFTQGISVPNRRITVFSNTLGTPRTITAGAVVGLNNIDFCDIVCAGAATWAGGTSIGDCGGNSGLITSTPKTVYWNLDSGGKWSATAWAVSSGGTPADANFPLAQDTAVIQNTGLNTAGDIAQDPTINWNIGSINMSGRTVNMTFTNSSTAPVIYGNWTFGTGVSELSLGSFTFSGRGTTQTITSNGKSFVSTLIVNNLTGTVQLADALICRSLIVTSGTFTAVTYNLTCQQFASNASTTRTVSMGSGTWTVTNFSTVWNFATTTGLTFNKGTANIVFTNSGAYTIFGGGLTYNKITIGGTGSSTLTISGNNTFSEIASTKTVAHTIILGATTQTVGAFTVSGSAGNLVTISGTAITSFGTLIYTGSTNVNIDYISITFVKVYNVSNTWYVGNNSTNRGSYGFIWASAAPVIASTVGGRFFIFF